MDIRAVVAICVAALLLPIEAATGQQTSGTSYKPGLGEFMLIAQARHAKLWLSGNMQNWDLADYSIDELKEGLEDLEKLIPVYKDLQVAKMIESTMSGPIKEVEDAIKARDRGKFATAFDKLTSACNSCHQASNRPFIVIQRPTGSPFPNQSFAPARN